MYETRGERHITSSFLLLLVNGDTTTGECELQVYKYSFFTSSASYSVYFLRRAGATGPAESPRAPAKVAPVPLSSSLKIDESY